MSWGAAGKSVGDAFKAGMKREQASGQMRDANDPTGQGYGGGRAPVAPVQQQAPAPTLESLGVAPGYNPSPAGVGPMQPLTTGPDQMSPLMSLMHAIWKRPTP